MTTWEYFRAPGQAILDLQLHRLTQMEREKILAELKEIQNASRTEGNSGQRQETTPGNRIGTERKFLRATAMTAHGIVDDIEEIHLED